METNFDFGVMNLKSYTKPTIVTGEEKVVLAIPLAVMAANAATSAALAGAAAFGAYMGLAKGVVDVIHVNDGVRTINRKA